MEWFIKIQFSSQGNTQSKPIEANNGLQNKEGKASKIGEMNKQNSKSPIGKTFRITGTKIKAKVVEDNIKNNTRSCLECMFYRSKKDCEIHDSELEKLNELNCLDGYHYEEVKK